MLSSRKNLNPFAKNRSSLEPVSLSEATLPSLFHWFNDNSLFNGIWNGLESEFLPAIDLHETKDHFVVEAELPGINPKDIKVSLNDGTLIISGEKMKEEKKEDSHLYYHERNYGKFERRIALPSGADPEKVEANYKHGIMTITIPKEEKVKPRTIKVKVEE